MSETPLAELPDPDSSLWAWLAHDLRFYRAKHDLSLTQLGKIIGRSRGGVSAIEHGRRRINDKGANILDERWNTGGHFRRLLRFARVNHDPEWFKTFMEFEAKALIMKIYSGQLIPALLQTPEYAWALLTAGRNPNRDEAVEARMARQEILTRTDPPELWVLLAETTLACLVGGKDVMRGQMARLLEISEYPNVTLRIVPNTAGANGGLDGPFKVITVSEGDLAFVEAPNGGRLVLDTDEVRDFNVRFDRIGAVALPVDSSRSMIEQLMEDL